MKRSSNILLSFFVLVLLPLSGYSATTEFRVLLDTDNNASTGCSVTTPAGPFTGVDQVLVTTVDVTTTGATVTSVVRQVCSAGTLGSPIPVTAPTPYPVGLEGASGNSIVESVLPLDTLVSPAAQIRLAFVAATGASVDSITQTPSATPLMWPSSLDLRRRHATGPGLIPQLITLDGQTQDWGSIGPFVAGGAGGPSTPKFINVYLFADTTNLWFRFDAKLNAGNAPVAGNDTYTVRQGKSLNVGAPGVLANDADPNGLPLTPSVVSNPQHGTLALDPSGAFTYINNGASSPVDTFTYQDSNGTATSNTATVTLNITLDHKPLAANDNYSVPHGGTLTVPAPGVLGNDTDSDGDHITAVLASGPQHGTLTLNANGSFTYTHDGSNTLQDTFVYRADDGVLTSVPATVTITIGPDAPPVAVNDGYTVNEGGTLTVGIPGLFGNDSDPDTPSNQWTAQVVSGPVHGVLTLGTGGAFTYVHDGSETISDVFTYRINDGIQFGNTATVNITVTPVNDAPIATADAYGSLLEDTPFSVNAAGGVLANDTDADTPHASLTAQLVTGPAHASAFALNPDGSFNYTPAANYNGTDSFVYHANDGALNSNDVTVTLTITAVNDAPSFTAGSNVTVNEDSGAYSQPWATAVSAGPADESGQALNFVIDTNDNSALFSTQPAISPSGTLTFTPVANGSGVANLTLHLHDSGGVANGGVDNSGTVSLQITVTAVNDAPANTVPGAQSMTEDTTFTFTGATAISVSDIDAGAGSLTVTLSAINGTLTLGSTAGLTVTGNGTSSVQATGTIAALNTGLNNTVYAPNANYSGSDTVTVNTNDNGNTGAGGPLADIDTIAFTINGVNDAPVITRPATATTNEDTPFTFSGGNVISIADVDAASGSLSLTLGVTNGTLTLSGTTGLTVTGNGTNSISASGNLTDLNNALNGLVYAPSLDYSGSDTLNIGINDNGNTGSGGPLTDSQSVAITVNPVNDPPVAVADAYSVNEDTTLTVVTASGVLANDTDVDTPHASLTAVLNVGPANASSFTLNPDGSFSYTPNANFSGTDSFTYHANDGAADSNIVTVTITVNPVNDAPVITRPPTATTNEDTLLTFSGNISIADVDAASGSLSLTLSVTNGVLTLSGTTGLTVSGNGTNSISASGTLANLNAALNGMTYMPNLNYNTGDTLNISVNDNGNTGSGGPLSDTQQTLISITAVNDAPVNSVPGTQTINEDTSLTFSSGNGNAITVSDVDAGGADVTVTLSTANGTITLGSTAGLTTVTGNGTGTVVATGPIATINSDLNGTVFTPTANFDGAATVTVTTNDNGNSGTGGAQQDVDPITVNVTAVNDAPVITRPAAIISTEDTQFIFNGGNTISIADVDAGAGSLSLTLSVSNGTLSLSGTTGLTVSGNGTSSISASGNLTDLNNALNGMTYVPNGDYSGPDTLNIGVNDNGNTGSGGPLTDSKSTSIALTAVNDAPVNSVPGTQTINEDTSLTFSSGNGNAITVSDVDAGGADVTVTLSSANGTITLGSTAGLTTVTGNGTGSVAATGPIATINADLNNTVFTPTANFAGATSVGVSTNDNGNTGTGGPLTTNSSITVNVTAVDDAPAITRPATATTNEDTPFTFSGGNVISIADVDAGAGSLSLTLGVTNGTLTLSGTTGLTVSGNGTNSITASGNLTDLNNALNGLIYAPAADYNGSDTLNIGVNDNGNTGTGGPLTDSKSVAITVNAVNDAPVAVADSYNTDEDTPLVVAAASGVLANDTDVDTPHASLTAVLNVGPTNASSFTLNADGSFSYTPNANFSGSDSFTYHAFDGSLSSNIVTVTITINAVDDAPAITRPAAVSTNEDTLFTFNGGNTISISDVDAGAGSETVTLGVTSGVLTLSGTTGLTVSGNGTGSITASGTLTNLNNALNGMTYMPNANYNGSDTLNIGVNDNGNTGTGGPLTDSKSTAITVNAVNDAPVAVADSYGTSEDNPLIVSAAAGVLANDTDVDTAHVLLTAVLNVGPTNASSFTLNADGSFSYTPNANFSGSDSFTYHANDGSLNSNIVTVSITITAVNDPPVNTMPPSPTMNQDSTLTMTPAAQAIQVSDVDAGGNAIQVQLIATNGTMTLNGTTGLSFTVGDGTADATMTFTGTIANINTALNGLQFTSTPAFFGTASIQIVTNDLGFTGAGGAQSDNDTLNINVLQQDQPPSNTVPGAQSVNEDTTLVFSTGNSNAISISDPDAGANPVKVTLSVTQGTLTLSGVAGLSFTVGDGTSDATMTFTGTMTAINTALQGMSYLGNLNYNGSDTLTITTNDQGFSGPGGPLSDTDTVSITINPVNDAPVAVNDPAVAGTYDVFKHTASQNTSLSINAANGVLANDTDIDTPPASLTAILVSGPSNAQSFTLNPDGSFNYVPALNFVGTDTFTYKANDGSLDSNVATATITVKNHAPSGGGDAFTGVGNTDLEVSTTFFTGPRVHLTGNLLTNDTDADGDTLSTVAETVPASLGGSATINADGTFRYSPAASATSETFTYHVTDGTDTTAVTVTITLNNRVWYAKNNVANGNGTSSSPFNTLAGANTASAVNEFIYIFNGDGTSTGYNGNFTIKSGVSVIGEGVALVVNANTLTTAGTKPTVTNSTPGVIFSLGADTTVRGIHFNSAGAAAITNSGNALGTMNVGDVLMDGAGGAFNFTTNATGSGTFTLDNSTINFNSGTATGGFFQATTTNVTFTLNANNSITYIGNSPMTLSSNSGSTFNFNGDMLLNNFLAGGSSIVLSGNANTTITFAGNISPGASSTSANCLFINANTVSSGSHPITFSGNVVFTPAAGIAGILMSNNTAPIVFSGTTKTINTTTQPAVTMSTNTGTVTFSNGGLTISNTSGAGIVASGGGTLTISGTGNTINTSLGGQAININGTTSGGITFATVGTSAPGPATAVALQSLGNGNVTINGGTLNATTTGISLTTLGTSTVTLSGVTITGPTTGISGTNFGTLSVGGTTNVSGASALVLNTGTLSGSFNNVNSTGGTNGVSLTAVTISGTVGVTGGALTGATGATFNVSGGGTGTLNWGGTISQANGATVVSIAGSNNGTINFNGNVTASGTSTGININTNTGTYSFAGTTNSITGSGGGILINAQTGGSVTFNSGTSINTTALSPIASFAVTNTSVNVTYSGTITNNNNGGKMLNIDTYSSGTLTMNGTSLSGNVAAPNGVISTLNNITGTVVINNLSETSSHNAFNNTLVAITGTNTGGSITFNHLVLSATGTGHTGKGVTMVGNGTLNITATGGASSIDVSAVALDLNATTLGTGTIATVNSSGGVNGIKLTNVLGGMMSVTTGTIAAQTGASFLVSGGTGSFSYGGSITQNTAGQRAVDIQSKTGGTITLSGAIGSTGGSGVFLSTNTGATITITGSMTLSTAAVNAFTATGGGTVNVNTGTNNITTTSGTAVTYNGVSSASPVAFNNVTSTTGGAVAITSAGATSFTFNDVSSTTGTAVSATTGTGTLTFHSIAANGAVDGVTVNGSYTGFTVNGTGTTAGSGGTIQNCTHNGMKIVGTNAILLKNMTLNANAATQVVPGSDTTCGGDMVAGTNTGCVANLFIQTATGVTLNNMALTNAKQVGFNGNAINGLTITGSNINNNGDETFEDGVAIQNLTGTCTITDTNIKDNASIQMYVENAGGSLTMSISKTAGTFNIGNSAHFGATTTKSLGLEVNGHSNGSAITLQVDGYQFLNNFGSSIQSNIAGTGSTLNGFVQNCTFNVGGAAVNIQNNAAATIGTLASPFVIQNNPTMRGFSNQAINVGQGSTGGSVFAKMTNNTIGVSGTAGSACDLAFLPSAQENCAGITLNRQGGSTFAATISSNTIQDFGQNGVTITANNNAQMSVVVSSNIIREPYFNVGSGHAAGNAIQSNIGVAIGGPACIDLKTNTISSDPTFSYDPNNTGAAIYTRSRNGSTVSIPGYAGGNSAANVQTFVAGANTFTAGFVGLQVKADNATGTFANGAGACSTP